MEPSSPKFKKNIYFRRELAKPRKQKVVPKFVMTADLATQ